MTEMFFLTAGIIIGMAVMLQAGAADELDGLVKWAKKTKGIDLRPLVDEYRESK